jgi:hypothetical protein
MGQSAGSNQRTYASSFQLIGVWDSQSGSKVPQKGFYLLRMNLLNSAIDNRPE